MLPLIAAILEGLSAATGVGGAAGGAIAGAAPAVAEGAGFMDKLGGLGTKVMGNNFAGKMANTAIQGQLSPFKGLLTKESYQSPEGMMKAFSPFMSPDERYSASLLTKAFPWKYANDEDALKSAQKKLLTSGL